MANENNKSLNESENPEDSNLVELGLDEGCLKLKKKYIGKNCERGMEATA